MSVVKRVFKFFVLAGLLVGVLGAGALAFMFWLFSPELPSIDVLKDVHLQTPLRVYTRDGRLMAEFGEKRRIPLRLDEVPPAMVQAVTAMTLDQVSSRTNCAAKRMMTQAVRRLTVTSIR